MPTLKDSKIPGIQYLRGVAAMAVLLFHFEHLLPSGHLGVDIFFVISGFVITNQINKMHELNTQEFLRKFLSSRIRRLMPALSTILIVSGLIYGTILIFIEDIQYMKSSSFYSWLYLQNYFAYFNSGNYFSKENSLNWLLPHWSLAVEMQIYFFYLIVMILIRKINFKYQLNILIAAALTSFTIWLLFSQISPSAFIGMPLNFSFYSPITRFWEFAAGAISYITVTRIKVRHRHFNIEKISLAIILLMLLLPTDHFKASSILMIAPVLVTAFFCAFCSTSNFTLTKSIVHKILVKLGDASYPIYLTHSVILFIISFNEKSSKVNFAVYLGLTLLLGIGIHQLIEKKFKHRKATKYALAYWAVVPLILLGSDSALRNENALLSPRIATPKYAGDIKASCFQNSGTGCVTGSNLDILLVGDSQAGSLSRVIDEISQELELSYSPYWLNGCPFFPVNTASALEKDSGDNRKCSIYSEATINLIKRASPKIVFIVNSIYAYKDFRDSDFMKFVQFLDNQSSSTTQFILVDKIPSLPKPITLTYSRITKDMPQVFSYSNESTEINFGRSTNSKIRLLDPRFILCDGNLCSFQKNSKILYKDQTHLSVDGARLLKNYLIENIRQYIK